MPVRTSRLSAEEDLHRLDATRRPDWRFQRALELVAHKRRPRWCKVRDDAAVRSMVTLLQRLRHSKDGGHEELAAELAGPLQALAIYERPDPELRLRLECEILAAQGDEQIAELLRIPAECVASFESVFFDVRARLDCVDWIRCFAICGNGSAVVERELKSIAYHLGPSVLHGPPGGNAGAYWEAMKLIAEFVASLKDEFTPLQVLELHRQIVAEQNANQAIAAFHAIAADAARELIVATGPVGGEECQPDAEPAGLQSAA